MGRKLKTIYECFPDYTEGQVDDIIKNDLTDEEILVVFYRNGDDLHNPTPKDNWNKEYSLKYYNSILPKIKNRLRKKYYVYNHAKMCGDCEDTDEIIEQPVESDDSDVMIEQPTESNATDEIIELQAESNDFDQTSRLIKLLKSGKTNQQICDSLNITSRQLYNELLNLKNNGVRHNKTYYSNGSIKYGIISSVAGLKKHSIVLQDKTIITEKNENKMKFLLISDLHFGNELERIDLVNRAYNYCIKNGINIILCGGDIIDGTFTRGTQTISDAYKQVEHFINEYPQDPSILTFSVAGDHDFSAFREAYVDIIEICNNYRHDVIIGGYNNTGINLKNDQILLYHYIPGGTMRITSAPIILMGHTHNYSAKMSDGALNVSLPSLSDIIHSMPTALELDIHFSKGYIVNSTIKQIYFGNKDVILNESSFDFPNTRSLDNDEVRNSENYAQDTEETSSDELILKKDYHTLSQIEKFNKRFKL